MHAMVAVAYDQQCEVGGPDWLHKSGLARSTGQLTTAAYWLASRVFTGIRIFKEHGSFLVGQADGISTDVFVMATALAIKFAWADVASANDRRTRVRQPVWCASLNSLRRATDAWLELNPVGGPDWEECEKQDTVGALKVLREQAQGRAGRVGVLVA